MAQSEGLGLPAHFLGAQTVCLGWRNGACEVLTNERSKSSSNSGRGEPG